jgi:hypothetical protein
MIWVGVGIDASIIFAYTLTLTLILFFGNVPIPQSFYRLGVLNINIKIIQRI